MKTYFRLLSFAKPIEKFAIPYILATVFAILFNTLNLTLLVPLLETLFSEKSKNIVLPAHAPSIFQMADFFSYHVNKFVLDYGRWGALKRVCGVVMASVFLSNVFRYLSQRTMENLRAHTLLKLRRAVYDNVIDLHLGYFSNERKGDILSKIASDVQVVQYSVTGTLQIIFKEPLQVIFYLFTLFALSPQLTLMSLLVVPISGFIISKIVKTLKKQAIAAQQTYGLMISYLDEALSGIRIIKAFNASSYIKDKLNQANYNYTRITKSMARRQQLASPVSETMGVITVAGIVLYGGYMIFNEQTEFTPAGFIGYIAVFSQLTRPIKAISDSFSSIHSGIAAGERVLEMIDVKPQIVDAPDAKVLDGFNEGIKLENVTFAYGDKVVLNDVSLEIPKGKTVALVGPSGGGKSTLMDLIPRFIEPQSGRVLIDGHDVNKVTMESLRGLLGVVNQESILFNDSIYNNIAFGKPDATQAQVEAAAHVANAHNFIINTEEGYQTNIGDRGTKLSGGQKQRVSIARAVLNNPPIMLLDEATSALDTESEKLVQDALNNLMKNRTSLIIAHRLSTIQNADVIVVLEQGRIVEQGTHQQLLQQNGLYRKLIDMQAFNQ